MITTSKESKQREKATNTSQIKLSLRPETAEAFREKCKVENMSMAGMIANLISDDNLKYKKTALDSVATRPHRRKALKKLICEIAIIMDAERKYMCAIPENLQGSCVYDAAEQTVCALEEALDILNEAY